MKLTTAFMLSAAISAATGIIVMEGAFGQRDTLAEMETTGYKQTAESVFDYNPTVADLNAAWEEVNCSWVQLRC